MHGLAFAIAAQPARRERARGQHHLFGPAAGHHLPARRACPWAHIHQEIGGAHEERFVLDYHQRVACAAQLAQRFQQGLHFGRVQAAAGFVQQHGQRGQLAAQQPGQADALGLTGRKRAAGPAEVQVTQPDARQKVGAAAGDGQTRFGQILRGLLLPHHRRA